MYDVDVFDCRALIPNISIFEVEAKYLATLIGGKVRRLGTLTLPDDAEIKWLVNKDSLRGGYYYCEWHGQKWSAGRLIWQGLHGPFEYLGVPMDAPDVKWTPVEEGGDD